MLDIAVKLTGNNACQHPSAAPLYRTLTKIDV
jgi:hypothetical protein